MEKRRRTIVFISSCPEPWGESEELWSQTAIRLVESGHRVHAIKMGVAWRHPRIQALVQAGVALEDYGAISLPWHIKVKNRLLPRWQYTSPENFVREVFCNRLQEIKPSLTVIAQKRNFDGLLFSGVCRFLNLRYAVISQMAFDYDWPVDEIRKYMRLTYFEACASFFVSERNRELTEMQLGARLPGARVVQNPFLIPTIEPLPWPDRPEGRWKLACIARMVVRETGQDTLLRVLATKKWQERPLQVTFFGDGPQAEGLRGMAEYLGVSNARFEEGFGEMTTIWRTHHAIVLPSRAEGQSPFLIEAMRHGRPAITMSPGGNAEIVADNETGFVAQGVSPSALDEALERAWARREEWERLGKQAAVRVCSKFDADPVQIMTDALLRLLDWFSNKEG